MIERWSRLTELLEVLGLDEAPMALCLEDNPPQEGFHPPRQELPTVDKERAGQVDYQGLQENFSCAIRNVWLARKKKSAAWFSAEHFGCLGAAFWLGFNRPQLDSVVNYVSSGVPDRMEGEHYLATPEECRAVFEYVDPAAPPKPYIVIRPLDMLGEQDSPLFVTFFCRPESLAGLHQLASYIVGEAEAVRSPFAPGCGSLWAWPRHFQEKGVKTCVLGGWDPSARKYYKTDELSFTIPIDMFEEMLERWQNSFLTKHAWKTSQSKIKVSKKAWKEL